MIYRFNVGWVAARFYQVTFMRRMMLSFASWFLTAATIPPCYARPTNLSVVLAKGPYSLTCQQGRQLIRDVQAIYARENIKLNLRRFRCIANPKKSRDRLTGYGIDNTHWWWDEEYFVGKNYRPRWIHHAILPPIQHDNSLWLAGQAYQSCISGHKVSTSNATIVSALGEPRYRHSVIAAAHEIGHSLGADHDNSLPATIMHGAALQYVNLWNNWLPISQATLTTIRQCNRGR